MDISSHVCGAHKLTFLAGSSAVSSRDCGDKNRYFKPNDDAFLTVTKRSISTDLPPKKKLNFNLIKHEVATESNAQF